MATRQPELYLGRSGKGTELKLSLALAHAAHWLSIVRTGKRLIGMDGTL